MLRPIVWYKDLHTSKGRKENGAFLVEGIRAISLVRSVRGDNVVEILVSEDDHTVIPYKTHPIRKLTAAQFKDICLSQHPSGPLAVCKIPVDAYEPNVPRDRGHRILVCEDIQDPGNLGTLIRNAAALDFSGVLLSDKCADPFSPKVVQASAGTIFSVWLRRTSAYRQCMSSLIREGFACVATDVHGKQALEEVKARRFLLVLGNEGKGLMQQTMGLATHLVTIPINESKAESLNVASSGAICMYVLAGNK